MALRRHRLLLVFDRLRCRRPPPCRGCFSGDRDLLGPRRPPPLPPCRAAPPALDRRPAALALLFLALQVAVQALPAALLDLARFGPRHAVPPPAALALRRHAAARRAVRRRGLPRCRSRRSSGGGGCCCVVPPLLLPFGYGRFGSRAPRGRLPSSATLLRLRRHLPRRRRLRPWPPPLRPPASVPRPRRAGCSPNPALPSPRGLLADALVPHQTSDTKGGCVRWGKEGAQEGKLDWGQPGPRRLSTTDKNCYFYYHAEGLLPEIRPSAGLLRRYGAAPRPRRRAAAAARELGAEDACLGHGQQRRPVRDRARFLLVSLGLRRRCRLFARPGGFFSFAPSPPRRPPPALAHHRRHRVRRARRRNDAPAASAPAPSFA